jgi:hypothetical protein
VEDPSGWLHKAHVGMIRPEYPAPVFYLVSSGKVDFGNSLTNRAYAASFNADAAATVQSPRQFQRKEFLTYAFFAGEQQSPRHSPFFQHASQQVLDALVACDLIKHKEAMLAYSAAFDIRRLL